jgi:hypothetical protein
MLYLVLGMILFLLLAILVIVIIIISQPVQSVQATQVGPHIQKGPGQGPAPEPRFSDSPLDYINGWLGNDLNRYLGNLYDINLPDYVDRDAYYSSWNTRGGSNVSSRSNTGEGTNLSGENYILNLTHSATGSNVNDSNAGGFTDYKLAAFGNFGNY